MNNFPGQLLQNLQQLKANPIPYLMQRRFNAPASMASDPSAIINYLLKTGQVTQEQINRAYQQMGQFRR